MKGLTLSILTILSVLYCLRFGYIWTAYGHGGQMIGIPFALLMIGLTIRYVAVKIERKKEKMFYGALFYFSALALFSITIEIIRSSNSNYFELLYVEPGGIVNKIFMAFAAAGVIATFLKFRQINKQEAIE
ncbi:hypothetical protein Q4E40_12425 [Pontibacter sp. BT731]|uniref:hypothetical protein n=1 Tax=Pontibacter coccineus TaxID=3063328 RepID=UPI0026E13663|nr:hypothetical protein [Pontibacter sp. BT731]MDO6390938.1 hypothetical protein [Pontibacter sp. BT731]